MGGFDAERYGLLIHLLRRERGIKNGDVLAEMVTAMGVKTSARSQWAIEGGRQVATVDRHLAYCAILRPEPGYFDSALVIDEASEGDQE